MAPAFEVDQPPIVLRLDDRIKDQDHDPRSDLGSVRVRRTDLIDEPRAQDGEEESQDCETDQASPSRLPRTAALAHCQTGVMPKARRAYILSLFQGGARRIVPCLRHVWTPCFRTGHSWTRGAIVQAARQAEDLTNLPVQVDDRAPLGGGHIAELCDRFRELLQ